MNQQRPGMPPMVIYLTILLYSSHDSLQARSQSGGGAPEWRPSMPQQKGGEHYMTQPPSMQRASTAPYGPGGVMQSPNQPMGMGGMGNMYRGGDMHGQQQMGGYGGAGVSHGRTISDSNLPYDASNFPVLQGAGGGPGGNPKNWYPGGMGVGQSPSPGSGMHGREEEFTIQNEDFPALPGSQPRMGTGTAIGRESGSSGGQSQSAQGESEVGGQQQPHHAQSPMRNGQGQGGKPSPQMGPHNPPSSPGPSSQQQAGTMSMGIGFGGGMMGGHAPPSPGMQPMPAPSAGSAPISMEAKYGLMGLLDVVKMTDRVSQLLES
jgi:hypothetical protein